MPRAIVGPQRRYASGNGCARTDLAGGRAVFFLPFPSLPPPRSPQSVPTMQHPGARPAAESQGRPRRRSKAPPGLSAAPSRRPAPSALSAQPRPASGGTRRRPCQILAVHGRDIGFASFICCRPAAYRSPCRPPPDLRSAGAANEGRSRVLDRLHGLPHQTEVVCVSHPSTSSPSIPIWVPTSVGPARSACRFSTSGRAPHDVKWWAVALDCLVEGSRPGHHAS